MIDVESIAEDFLASIAAYVWDGVSLPVPIEDIADSHAGLLIRDVQDLATAPGAPPIIKGQSLSGLLLPARGEIWVSTAEASDWPARRRFTIAHELGHWCLHGTLEHSVFCRASTVDADPVTAIDSADPVASMEREANAFAAAVLMPAHLIREHYAASGRDFARLCETFGSSGSAMGRRLRAVIPPRASS